VSAPTRAALLLGFAHELRNLVGVFMGGGELLADEVLAAGPSADADATLQDLRRAGERARRLLARMSGLAALESMDLGDFEPADVLAARVPRLQRLAVGTRLQVVVDSDVGPACGSGALFEAVLADLVDNAARAAGEGGAVTIRLAARDGGGVRLAVVDDGSGMSPVHAAQAFEPFFTTDAGRWGLGLPMVQAAVEAMGGDVALETGAGRGTSVRVRLPPALPAREPASSGPRIVAGAAPRVVALVVDDDPQRCTVLRRRLEGVGCEVLVAGHPDLAPLLLGEASAPVRLVVLPSRLTGHDAAAVAGALAHTLPAARMLEVGEGPPSGWAQACVAETVQQGELEATVRGLLSPPA
jgi:hypothetical protein